MASFIDECITAHNQYRARHNAPPLVHDPQLSQAAQRWADQVAASGQFAHSKNRNNVGENIAMKWTSDGGDMSGLEATNQWYSEIKDYRFQGEENMNCGHFSQVVWVGSTKAGFGKAQAADGSVYVVGQYAPAGNFMGKWKQNVLPPVDGRTDLIDENETKAGSKPASGKGPGVSASLKGPGGLGLNADLNANVNLPSFGGSKGKQAPTAGAGGGGGALSGDAFIDDCLRAHNAYRARHQAPPLSHDPELTRTAQKWADQVAASGQFAHSTGRKNVGENIAMKWSSDGADMTGLDATNQWYSEIKDYRFRGEENMNCGHFSQVVWVGSTKAGFGKAQAADGSVYVVGQYAPAGNFMGKWRENVLPPADGRTDLLEDGDPALGAAGKAAPSAKAPGVNVNANVNSANPSAGGKGKQGPAPAAGSSSGSGGGGAALSGDAFIDDCLRAHNVYRARHQAPPLGHDADLSRAAQKWADHVAASGQFAHSTGRKNVGENIAMKWTSDGGDMSGLEATNQWYSEIKDYRFRGEENMNCGHFSQVVWVGSTKAGFGKAQAADGSVYVVGQYAPAGNFMGKWRENVLPPADGRTDLLDEGSLPETAPAPKAGHGVRGDTGHPQAPAQEPSPHDPVLAQHMVDAHNKRRARHGAPPLTLNEELSQLSQSWADNLVSRDAFEHSLQRYRGSLLGENIACKWLTGEEVAGEWGSDGKGFDRVADELVGTWYAEENKYDYSGKAKVLNAGHFTQVVWRDSREIGVGRALVPITDDPEAAARGDMRVVVVCSYFPPGNVINRFADNVVPPK